jgi:hypothetical protein
MIHLTGIACLALSALNNLIFTWPLTPPYYHDLDLVLILSLVLRLRDCGKLQHKHSDYLV